MNTTTTRGLAVLLGEFNLSYDYDPWGQVMGWLFAVCDVLTDSGLGTPPEWDFHQSPMGSDTDSYEYQTLQDLYVDYTDDDLLAFGHFLNREADQLRAAGQDY